MVGVAMKINNIRKGTMKALFQSICLRIKTLVRATRGNFLCSIPATQRTSTSTAGINVQPRHLKECELNPGAKWLAGKVCDLGSTGYTERISFGFSS